MRGSVVRYCLRNTFDKYCSTQARKFGLENYFYFFKLLQIRIQTYPPEVQHTLIQCLTTSKLAILKAAKSRNKLQETAFCRYDQADLQPRAFPGDPNSPHEG